MRAPIIATHPVRTMTRRPWLSLGLLVFGSLLPPPAAAVVCAFTNFMPNGPEPVGFAEDWVTTAAGVTPTHLQWWFPAQSPDTNPPGASPPNHLSLHDYALSRTRDPRLPEPQATTLARREINQRAEAARARGASPVRYLHVGAAAMLAI